MRNNQEFNEWWDDIMSSITPNEEMALWNAVADKYDSNYDHRVYENDDEFFQMFSSTWEAIRACYFGDYRPNDTYVWFLGNGNCASGEYYEAPIRSEWMKSYYCWHQNKLQEVLTENNIII